MNRFQHLYQNFPFVSPLLASQFIEPYRVHVLLLFIQPSYIVLVEPKIEFTIPTSDFHTDMVVGLILVGGSYPFTQVPLSDIGLFVINVPRPPVVGMVPCQFVGCLVVALVILNH